MYAVSPHIDRYLVKQNFNEQSAPSKRYVVIVSDNGGFSLNRFAAANCFSARVEFLSGLFGLGSSFAFAFMTNVNKAMKRTFFTARFADHILKIFFIFQVLKNYFTLIYTRKNENRVGRNANIF